MFVRGVVPQRLVSTWIVLAVALLAVLGSGPLVVWKLVRHVTVECKGHLRAVPARELGATSRLNRTAEHESNMEIRWDEKPGKRPYDRATYTNVRVAWTPPDATCACSDMPIRWQSYGPPTSLRIYRDDDTGLYVVRERDGSPELAVFRRVNDEGRRIQWDRVVDPHNLSTLIFVLSLGALGLAMARAIRATPYATRMYQWHTATLRHDGLVESEHGASLGMMELRSRVPSGPVIVDPSAVAERDAYRGLPILTRRNVGAGSHQQWWDGTMRRLRDARMLAIIAAVTTMLALVARFVGA